MIKKITEINISKIRKKRIKDLEIDLLNFKYEHFKLKMSTSHKHSRKTHKLTTIKRNIAKIKTVLSEKKICI